MASGLGETEEAWRGGTRVGRRTGWPGKGAGPRRRRGSGGEARNEAGPRV